MAVIKPISLTEFLPEVLNEEVFETLLSRPGIRLERILSKGQKTPEGTWYEQSEDEWVLLIQGRAQLCIEGQNELVHLAAGDSLWLPAQCRHRVAWTDPNAHCIWLALHLAVEP